MVDYNSGYTGEQIDNLLAKAQNCATQQDIDNAIAEAITNALNREV